MDLSAHISLARLAEAIAAVQAAAAAVGCDIYVMGGLARDLWLEFGHGIDTGRRTEDVDFGMECPDWQTFKRLARELEARQLRRDRRVQHKFRHPNGIEIDVIPFGGVEERDRTIAWPPDGNPVMSLVGFTEVATSTVIFVLPGRVTVRVVPLPALAVLKLLAWEDRRGGTARDKDARDLVVIAEHYLEVCEPELPTKNKAELLERHGYEEKLASAELLGSDMAVFGSDEVREAVQRILDRETDSDGPLGLARIVSSYDPVKEVGFVRALCDGFFRIRGV